MTKTPSKRTKSAKSNTLSVTPPRRILSGGTGASLRGGNHSVVVSDAVQGVGPRIGSTIRRGEASTGHYGAAIAGDKDLAATDHGGVALAGNTARAAAGDNAVAKAASRSNAVSYIHSVAMVDDEAWAYSAAPGTAIARFGLAQTALHGVAAAHADQPSSNPPQQGRGIAIAGPAGIALAYQNGVLVSAGAGGALAGYYMEGSAVRLVIERVCRECRLKPDTLYRFEDGVFWPLSKSELIIAERQIADWCSPWTRTIKAVVNRLRSLSRRKGRG